MRDVSFGQFYPTQSVLHRMDARIKILLTIVFIVCVFVAKSLYGMLCVTAFLLLTVLCSRVPVKSVLISVKAILFFALFAFILNLFSKSKPFEVLYFEWWIFRITDASLKTATVMAVRLIYLVMGTSLLTLTTTPVCLTDAIESLLSPLKLVRFPVHELALIMSIALRFIPTLMDETDRIICAQKARGADFESGNLIKRAKAMLPILIPLLIGAFRKADDLSDAMDSRCYAGAKGRTKYKKQHIHARDVLAAIITLSFLAAIIVLQHFQLGMFLI
ncbi:MAG: energy-coupling factor transporter transmembrane protein EcfT [Clostridia bacterium]|nr:energy-coupling factor transporter transmembrane protein EcfT [Clostridia bacterium]